MTAWLCLAACLTWVTFSDGLFAQEIKENAADKSKTSMVIDTDNFTPAEKLAQEAVALEFAEAHHPELAKLLKNLKKHDPNQYNKGISELRKTILRLDKVREKIPEKYDRELQSWRVNSEIRLQVARILLTDKQEDHDKLTAMLMEKRQLEINHLQSELERLTSETKKLEDRKTRVKNDLSAKSTDIPSWVKLEKERLLKSGKPNFKAGDKNSLKNKPASKSNADNSNSEKSGKELSPKS